MEFSIVLTTYMLEKYIHSSVQSVLDQTFKDFELIIIDDGSTDNTKSVCENFRDPRIQYHYQTNSGLPAIARNIGIKRSRGKYIAFLDGDDIWYPEKLSRCFDIFKNYPEVDLVCHDEVMKDSFGNTVKKLSYGPFAPNMFRRLLFRGNYLSTSAAAVRREVIPENGHLFRENPDFFSVEDYDLWIRLSKKHTFYFIPEVLGVYQLHERNISSRFEKHYKSLITMLKTNYKEYREKKIFDFLLFNIKVSRTYFILVRDFIRKGKIKKTLEYSLKTLFPYV